MAPTKMSQAMYIFSQLYLLFIKYFLLSFLFCYFTLFVKCFQGCVFSPGNQVKKNVFYRVTVGDLLIEKGIPFCQNQFPDITLY